MPKLKEKFLSCNISLSRQLTISSSPTLHVPIVSSFFTFTFWKEISFSIQERFSFAFNLAEASFPVNLQSPTQLCALLLCHFHTRKVLLMEKSDIKEPFFHGKVTSNKTKPPTHLFPLTHDLRLYTSISGFLLCFLFSFKKNTNRAFEHYI